MASRDFNDFITFRLSDNYRDQSACVDCNVHIGLHDLSFLTIVQHILKLSSPMMNNLSRKFLLARKTIRIRRQADTATSAPWCCGACPIKSQTMAASSKTKQVRLPSRPKIILETFTPMPGLRAGTRPRSALDERLKGERALARFEEPFPDGIPWKKGANLTDVLWVSDRGPRPRGTPRWPPGR